MYDRYIRVAAASPAIKTADCFYNAQQILSLIRKAQKEDVKLLCLPELCITGFTCGDLFFQEALLDAAKKALDLIVAESAGCNVLVAAGIPVAQGGKLYNMAAVFCKGKILGFVPKSSGGLRYFAPGDANLLFRCENMPEFTVAVEICEDLTAPLQPSIRHAMAGATIIANLSADNETVGKAEYRRTIIKGQSAQLICGYVYANAGYGESTTDTVFSGHNIICEKGAVLDESLPFGDGLAISEIDLSAISHDRRKMNTFAAGTEGYTIIPFSLDTKCTSLTRFVDPAPFVPKSDKDRQVRCKEVLNIQAAGLAKRLEHTAGQKSVIGVSGGLDSSLALLVVFEAHKMINKPASDILAVTMPCFGTTERTLKNSHNLCNALGISCREINISGSVNKHLEEIDHRDKTDVTFENAQARMRTLVLMDLANQAGGMVIGTGDLSELALGWATYNGDHMSMYGVNAGVPKTLVRHIIQFVAQTSNQPDLPPVLADILNTPVSPELLPGQRTEDMVGPYELHDFFLYHIVRYGRRPSDIFRLACIAFNNQYSQKEILKWQNVFYQRFFAQQFKRSCLPDGPKIGSVALSPRGEWKMPSDAISSLWMEELKNL